MSGFKWIVRSMALILLALSLTACSATHRNHGFMPADDQLDLIIVGVDTRDTVTTIIGAPGTSGLLTSDAWYYVQSRFRHFTYNAPEEIDRQVLAISFDDSGVVENIEQFGLENGQVVVLSRRVTDSNIKGVGFLRQLFGAFGNFDLSQVL